jgi:hypothetical protein
MDGWMDGRMDGWMDGWIVEHEMYGHTGNNWNHRNSDKRFKEEF